MPGKTEKERFLFTVGKTYPQFQKIMYLEGEEERGSAKEGKCDGQRISTGICQTRAVCCQSCKLVGYIKSDFSIILDILDFNRGRFPDALN